MDTKDYIKWPSVYKQLFGNDIQSKLKSYYQNNTKTNIRIHTFNNKYFENIGYDIEF
jgi:hypothetical protein